MAFPRPITRSIRASAVVALGFSALVLLLLAACWATILRFPEPSTEGVGNRPEILERIGSGGPDFRFAVLGDVQKGIGSFRVLQQLLAGVDFAVHCGDMVASNDEGHWRLFFDALAVRPLAAAPGNHDIKGEPACFERYFGPRQFSFARGSCRFIVLDASARNAPCDAEWLAAQMESAREPNLFLFMHRPPFDTRRPGVRPRAGWERFLELVQRHRVRAVFSGHEPVFLHRELGGTLFVVNGLGGDYESWDLDAKAHAILVQVSGDRVREHALTIPPVHGAGENLTHLAVGHVWTEFRGKPLPCWGGLVLLLLADASLLMLLRRRRARATNP